MYSPDVAIGLDSIVYALCKLDGQLHPDETKLACDLLTEGPYSDLAICAMFLRDNMGELAEEASAFGRRRQAGKRVDISQETRKRFVRILLRVARAHEGISREERAFIRQFWWELHRM
ncbi:tellurite resistance TerB family protein [Spirosoma gilvum]